MRRGVSEMRWSGGGRETPSGTVREAHSLVVNGRGAVGSPERTMVEEHNEYAKIARGMVKGVTDGSPPFPVSS